MIFSNPMKVFIELLSIQFEQRQ
uniref:Uncharacterized protein n=1 Tax=Ralstonia solanacearum TaxID=305 RepID=A0A0S4TZU9_RALSL|nr:protein of unknown function [Ralstonia solanacearum]